MEQPTLEQLDTDGILDVISSIDPETPKEDLIKHLDFLIKQLNMSHEMSRRNTLVLMKALEEAQTKYLKYEQKFNWKLFVKKILIGLGWYHASLEELKEINFGKAGNSLPKKGS